MPSRPYDLILFGASGFTGQLAAHYLDAHAPAGLRWAIAGRNRQKLARLGEALSQPVPTIVGSGTDPQAMASLASSARVVCATAGPFQEYADHLVAACADHGTHYCDITGETPWVRSLIDRFHDRARQTGARIVPFCGFDSIPSDLGTLMMVEHLREQGQGTVEVATAFRVRGGGLNGGTLASALTMAERGQMDQLGDPNLLDPPEFPGHALPDDHRVFRDPDLGLVGPFFMAPINTRVVRRSAALFAMDNAPYGSDFHYREHLAHRGRLTAWAMAAGGRAGEAVVKRTWGRKLLRKLGPSPGQGPTDEARAKATTACHYTARGEKGGRLQGRMFVQGDAGNTATVLMLVESALALATQTDTLPDRAGILTPATALGHTLLARLREAGMTWEVGTGG